MSKIRMKRDVIDAIIFLRENNHTIPDEILDLMKGASLKEVERIWDMDIENSMILDKEERLLIRNGYLIDAMRKYKKRTHCLLIEAMNVVNDYKYRY